MCIFELAVIYQNSIKEGGGDILVRLIMLVRFFKD